MYFTNDPHAGLSATERLKRMYKFNETYDEDVIDIIKLFGGEKNINNVAILEGNDLDPELQELERGTNVIYTPYEIKVNNLEEVKLNKEVNFRLINGQCSIYKTKTNRFIIRVCGVMLKFLEQGEAYYKSNLKHGK